MNEADLVAKNQNLFNALMDSTSRSNDLIAALKSAKGHLNLYYLFSCVGGDSYDPECAENNVDKAKEIITEALTKWEGK